MDPSLLHRCNTNDSITNARGFNEPQIVITQAENSLQSFRSSLLRLSSADDAEQGALPFDIRALFDQQAKERPSNPHEFARQASIFSDFSNVGEAYPGSFGSLTDTLINLNGPSTQGNDAYGSSYPDNRPFEVNTTNRFVRTSLDLNKTCPYCGVTVHQELYDTSKFMMFAGYGSKRQYLSHKDCHIRSNVDPRLYKLVTTLPITQPKIQFSKIPSSPPIHKNYTTKDREGCFLSVEGYHPISSYLYFKVDRICYVQQNTVDNKEFLFMDLATKSTNVFEPTSYTVPWDEFRLSLSFYMFGSDEEPYKYDFPIDLSNAPSLPNNEHLYAEVQYSHGGNNITLSLKMSQSEEDQEILWETKSRFQNNLNSSRDLEGGQKYKSRTISVTFKQLSVNLPLQKISSPIKLNWSGEPTNIRATTQINVTSSAIHQRSRENSNGQTFLSSFLGSPLYEAKALNHKIAKQHSLGTSLNTANTTNNTSRGPPGISSNSNDLGSYFAFASGRWDKNRAVTCKPSPAQQQIFYSRQPSLGDPEEYFVKNDESPLLDALNYRNVNTSPGKQTSPIYLWPIDQKDASVSENASLSKASGLHHPTVSTLGSFENETINTNICGSRTNLSLAGLEVEDHQQQPQGVQHIKPESINETDEFLPLDQYLGKLDQVARSYQGSKEVQQLISKANPQEIKLIVDEISQNIEDLMLDPYANYMIQSLIQNCSSEQRFMLLQKIAPSMVKIACHKKGTHSLQVIVPLLSKEAELQLFKEAFQYRVPELAVNTYATHVIQKLITVTPVEDISFLCEPILQHFIDVATHSYGILTIKHLMGKVEKCPDLKQQVVSIIFENFELLIQDQNGNYAIQYALEYYPADCNLLFEKILVRVISYSSQKFSSTVIEKCLTNAHPQYIKKVVSEIMKGERLPDLMKNKYGNYVLLHVLLASEQEERERVMQGIFQHTSSFHGTKYKQRWTSFLEENPLNIVWSQSNPALNEQIDENQPSENSGMDDGCVQVRLKEADLEKIKKVWRNWNRREKKDGQKSPSSQSSKQALSFEHAAQMNVNNTSNTNNYGYNDNQQRYYSSTNQKNKKTWNKGKREFKGKNEKFNNNNNNNSNGWYSYN